MSTPITYAARLQEAISHAEVTVRELADHLGMTTQAIYKVLRGESKSLQASHHLKACKFLGASGAWLADGSGRMEARRVEIGENPEYPAVRHVAVRFSAGISGYEVGQIDGDRPIVFRADWLAKRGFKPERLVAVSVEGASMEPTLYGGDLVVINVDERDPKDGEVYALRFEDQAVIKRLFRSGGSWWMHSDNPDQRRYPRRECQPDQEIVGRVVYRQSEHL